MPVVVGGAHVDIGIREERDHLGSHGIDQVPRFCRKLPGCPDQFRGARTYVSTHVVEGDKSGSNGSSLSRAIDSSVRVPELSIGILAHSTAIESRPAQFAEIPSLHGWAGDTCCKGPRISVPDSFIAEEEERFVFDDGAARGCAKIVVPPGCQLAASGVAEPVVGGQHVVAQIIPGTAMELVGARAGDQIHHRSTAETDLGGKVGLLDFELLHRVHRRSVNRCLDAAVLLETGRTDAVHEDICSRIAAAVGDKVVGHATANVSARNLVDSWTEAGQVKNTPSEQGQIINEGAVQLLPGRTVLARKQRSGRHDFYSLGLGS